MNNYFVSDRSKLLVRKCNLNEDEIASSSNNYDCYGGEEKNTAKKTVHDCVPEVFVCPVVNETGTSEIYVDDYKLDENILFETNVMAELQRVDHKNAQNLNTGTYGSTEKCLNTDGLIRIESELPWEKEEDEGNSNLSEDTDDSIKDPNYEISQDSEEEFDNDNENENVDFSNQISTENIENQDLKTSKSEKLSSHFRKKKISGTLKNKQNRKLCRNSGKSYVTDKQKHIRERVMKPLKQNCRRKCRDKVNDDVRLILFHDYWNMGNYDRRISYISTLIKAEEKKVTTLRTTSSNGRNREQTFSYFLEVNNERIQVCKECFCATFDETNKFISTVIKKKLSSRSGILQTDQRGKHAPSHKISEDRLELVINHIKKFPAYESHYSRRHTDKKYLSSDLTKIKMYNLYCQDMDEIKEKSVSIKVYSEAIDSLNLKFKKPSNDTCKTCDVLQMKIQSCATDLEKNEFRHQLENHHLEADGAYNSKKEDKLLAEKSPEIKVVVFDLQQILPTPYLTTGTVFYKRQLHTYNLTIHDCSDQTSTHFMWHEAIAGRGANEIASCLFKYFKDIKYETHIICYSDTCGGQNKNSYVAAMFTYLLSINEKLKIVDHKFLIPGHTHMECDSDHAVIEKAKKKSPFHIHLPRDWYNLVRLAGKKKNKEAVPRFTVVEMKKEDFFDFSLLLKGPLVHRKQTDSRDKFSWKSVKWFRYETNFGIIKFKTSLNRVTNFEVLNFKRKTVQPSSTIEKIKLKILYETEKAIDKKKKANLLELLELVDESAKEFYKNLMSSGDLGRDVDPDIDNYFSDEEF